MNPPVIVIHGNSLEHVTDAYKRFLEGRFRAHFKLTGTPLRIEMRSSKNPFVDKDAALQGPLMHGLTAPSRAIPVLRCPAPELHHGA